MRSLSILRTYILNAINPRKLLLYILFMVCAPLSYAQPAPLTAHMSCSPPELRKDGTPMGPGEMAEFRLYDGVVADPMALIGVNTKCSFSIPAINGQVIGISSVDSAGLESLTLVTGTVIVVNNPNPPYNLIIIVQ